MLSLGTLSIFSEDIKCNIGLEEGWSLSPTLFGIYIDKLDNWLETIGCANTILVGIATILLVYSDAIVLLEICPYDIDKKLRILWDFYSKMGNDYQH